MSRRLSSLALLLAVVLPATVFLAAGSGPDSPVHLSGQRHTTMTATPSIEAPLAVLPVKASVDDREVGNQTEPWRVLVLGTLVSVMAACFALHQVDRRSRRPLRFDPARQWARFRAPPTGFVPTLRG
jgi:hypothetical protein